MIKVGITGPSGFIATHLRNALGLYKDKYSVVPFARSYFQDQEKLRDFVVSCDVLVHLAALNRHHAPEVIYETNMALVKSLIAALEGTGAKPHVIFSSSIQEAREHAFGKSKREGRELLSAWAEQSGGTFTGMIIPNVFGPFGRPYYNSVVATFCHQLTHGETPVIEADNELPLIYIGELVEEILQAMERRLHNPALQVKPTQRITVSGLLSTLQGYQEKYFERGVFPRLHNRFERDLFNTFRCYMDIAAHYPVKFTQHRDDRGSFVETVQTELSGQTSFSVTLPNIVRGNHFHTRKIERFAVIKGEAEICLRRVGSDEVIRFKLSGEEPAYVDMPIWYTHNITNVGSDELYTLFWVNEFFDPEDPDTYFEEV